jgi:GNAT superfamily N-acetyltransferase
VSRLRLPEPLLACHVTERFASGEESLDHWLKTRAWKNQQSGASRTFVACDGNAAWAYYALSSGAIAPAFAPGKFRRNMPDPVPVAVLGRLGVDLSLQGQGIGRALVRDAGLRVLQAAGVVGIRGLVVHALSENAARFYEHAGFTPSPTDKKLWLITLGELEQAVATASRISRV